MLQMIPAADAAADHSSKVQPFREPAAWLLTLLFLLHGTAYAIADPAWQAPDEPQHVATIRYVRQHGTYPNARTVVLPSAIAGTLLPSHFFDLQQPQTSWWRGATIKPWRSFDEIAGATAGGLLSVDGHPPAYYYLMAPFEAAASRLSFPAEVIVLRLVTLLIALPAILFGYAAIRVLWPSRRALAVAAGGIMALLPQLAHISGSVSNDPMLITLFTAVLFLSARMVADGITRRTALWTALAGAGAVLTKEHGALVIGVIGLAMVSALLARNGTLPLVALAIGVPLLAAAGWYGSRLALGLPVTTTDAFPRPPDPHPVSFLSYVHGYAAWQLNASFWGAFGWLAVRLPRIQYRVLEYLTAATCAISAVVAVGAVVRKRATRVQVVVGGAALACGVLITSVVFLLSWRTFRAIGQPRGLQGRYLFPVVAAVAVMIAAGIMAVVPRRARRVTASVIVASMAGLAGEGLLKILRAYYGPRGTGITTLLHNLSRFSPITVAGPLLTALIAAGLVVAFAVAVLAARVPRAIDAPARGAGELAKAAV